LSHLNFGTGEDCTRRELVQTVAKIVEFASEIKFDATKPDGVPRKLMNVDRLRTLGSEYSISLANGLNYLSVVHYV
jgi:GDP-L-fucose synthase